MRSPRDINDAFDERKSRTLILQGRVKSNYAIDTAIAIARIRCRNHHRTVSALLTGAHIQRVQPLHKRAAKFFRARHHINGSRHRINHRRAHNADVASKILIAATARAQRAQVRIGRRNDVRRINKTRGPVRRGHRQVIRVEGIHRVIHRCDDHNIVNALARNRHVRHHQRLRINLIIDRAGVTPTSARTSR